MPFFGGWPPQGLVDPLLDAHAVDFRGSTESWGELKAVDISTANVGALDVCAECPDLSATLDIPLFLPVFAIGVGRCEEEWADFPTPLSLSSVCESVSGGMGDLDLFPILHLDAAICDDPAILMPIGPIFSPARRVPIPRVRPRRSSRRRCSARGIISGGTCDGGCWFSCDAARCAFVLLQVYRWRFFSLRTGD